MTNTNVLASNIGNISRSLIAPAAKFILKIVSLSNSLHPNIIISVAGIRWYTLISSAFQSESYVFDTLCLFEENNEWLELYFNPPAN